MQQSGAATHWSFESAITIVLAALTAILTALAIMIGVMAIWGYGGLKEYLRDLVTKRVDEAMQAKLNEYPQAAELLDLTQRLRSRLDFLDEVQNQIITSPESKTVENASTDGTVAKVPESVSGNAGLPEQPILIAEPYPGEDKSDASGTGKTSDQNADPDAGPGHREKSDPSTR